MTNRVYYSTDASAPTLSGTAGSLISVLDACLVNGYGTRAAAGWTKPYSGTNLAMYQQGTGGNSHILRVDDTNAQSGRVLGCESATAISSYTNAFPTEAQFSGGLYVYKSSTANSTARPWVVVATERFFYLYVGSSDSALADASSGGRPLIFFGSTTSFKSGDAYHTTIIAGTVASTTSTSLAGTAGATTAVSGHYMARSHTQIGTSIPLSKVTEQGNNLTQVSGAGIYNYPDSVTGGMLLAPFILVESTGASRRGKLPGAWFIAHSMPGACGDTFTGTGAMAGKTFVLLNSYSVNTGAVGRVAIEISDTI